MGSRTILSVLIPSIPSRSKLFGTLWKKLSNQQDMLHAVHPTLGEVELIFDDTVAFLEGGLSIGKKREALVNKASGKYLCFVDDDEDIAPNYLETLVRLCQHDRDVATFKSFARLGTFWAIIDMSLSFPNDQASPMFTVRRKPWHICPVRSVFAKQVKFSDSNYGEDFDWMGRVLEFCTSEAKTEAVLHEYHHGVHSEADKIINHV